MFHQIELLVRVLQLPLISGSFWRQASHLHFIELMVLRQERALDRA
jgi:hypothetical protein